MHARAIFALRFAGAHALVPLAAAATSVLLLKLLLLARRSTSALACRGIRRRLCPVRVERGEDSHVPLASASASAAATASNGAETQLLAW